MLQELVPLQHGALSAEVTEEMESAADFALHSKAGSTRRAYATDWRTFERWCDLRGLQSLPASASTLAAFLGWQGKSDAKPSSIGRRLAAIRYRHKLAGYESPTADERVRAVMAGIRRTKGVAPVRKAPATNIVVSAMIAAIDGDGPKALRDRALLLLGFSGAFRRSELVALDVADLRETEKGYEATIRRSKTDQEGEGTTIAIVRGAKACPVQAVKAWLEAAGITEGPIFRPVAKGGCVAPERLSDHAVPDIVKDAAERAGLDPAIFSGHSLRAGFVTSAAANGASVLKMMEQSRHRSIAMLQVYIRSSDIFKDHAGEGLL